MRRNRKRSSNRFVRDLAYLSSKLGYFLLGGIVIAAIALTTQLYIRDDKGKEPDHYVLAVNGKTLPQEGVAVYEEGGKVMIPLRLVMEALGYKVTWENASSRVDMNEMDDHFHLHINESYYFVNEMEKIQLMNSPSLTAERTYVPVEFFKDVVHVDTITVRKHVITIEKNH